METPSTPIAPAAAPRLALVYDSETSGIPLWKEPSGDPRQPHIVGLAGKVVNLDTREVLESMNVIIRPDGWDLSPEVVAVHGITMERAMDEGIPEAEAIELLLTLWAGRHLIGHNESFDRRMVRIAIKRFLDPRAAEGDELVSEKWKAATGECTCWLARPHTKLPKNKLPKLTEAYSHFTGKPMEGAHTAMGDVNGCLVVYWAIQDLMNPAAVAPELQAA